jgi:hypothetical protein
MGIGEAGAAEGNKPQAHTDEKPSARSEQAFNEALRRSEGSASSTQAAAGTAARASGGKPAIVRIDANYRSKSATATLSDGSKVPLALTKNQLAPGDTLHNLEYGPESGPQDSPVVELSCASGASCSILWTQPSDYALSPKVIVSIKQDPEEGARRRLEQLPQYIQEYVNQVGGGENLESRAKMGEDLVKTGAKKKDFAPVEMEAKAPADPDFKFVEAARKGRYSQFPSFDEFKKDLETQVAYAKQQARTNGLNPPDPFEGAEWKDNPAAAKEKWDKYVFAQYDKAVKNEAAGLRHVGEVASMAQNAIFEALGLSAALGTGGAFLVPGLTAAGEWLAVPTLLESSTGVSYATWAGQFAKFGLGVSFGMNLINRGKEGIDAGMDPLSMDPIRIFNNAVIDTGGGRVVEKFTNKSNLTGKELNLSTGERVIGGITDLIDGGMNILGVREVAKMPGVGEPPIPRGTTAEPTGNDTPPPNDAIARDAGKLAAPAKPDYRLNGPVTLNKPTTDITLTREARPINWIRGVDPGPAFAREVPATSGGSSASAPGPGRSPAAEGRTRPVNPNRQMAVGNDGPPRGPKPPAEPEARGDVRRQGAPRVEPVRQGVVGGTIGGDTANILGTLGIAPEKLPDLREGRWVSGTMTRGSGQMQTRFRYDGDRLTASFISGDNPPSNIDLAAIRHQSIQLGEELGAKVVRLQIEMVGQEHAAFLQANNFKPVDNLDGILRLDIPIKAAPIKATPIEATPKLTSQFTREELNAALQKLVPKDKNLQSWGGMIWGSGEKGALSLIGTRSRAELLQIKGLTLESATQLRDIMLAFRDNGLGGAAPVYRVQLLNDIIKTLGG